MREKFDSKMKAALSEEKMKDLTPIIEKAGTFEKIEKQSIEEKDGLYTVILVAKYSKEQRTFIITYNDKEEIAGLVINKKSPSRMKDSFYSISSGRYSKISPGWHSNALQMASKVENRTAFAFPFFKIERLAIVIPTFSESSVTLIFLFANITSILIIIAILFTSDR